MAGNGPTATSQIWDEMHKIFITPREGVNVALSENGAIIGKPGMEASALNGDLKTFTLHQIGHLGVDGSQEGIVVEVRDNFLLNQIKFLLWDKDDRTYSYYLEVSMDGKYWTRICDYTKYACRSWQFIAFPKTVLRFIKIVGTHNSLNTNFHVVTIQAYLASEQFELDRKWNLLVPKFNVAKVEFGAKVIHGEGGNYMINGDLTRRHENYTKHTISCQPIVLQLSQPYVLDSIRLLLWDTDDRLYNYEINVSTDMVSWKTIVKKQNVGSWQTIKFDRVPVTFIRIMGSHNTKNNLFHVLHFECPAQEAGPEAKA